MKVAIGIPTYNRASFLLETIKDVLNQDPPADEIVVVDQSDWYPDGSREKLLELAKNGTIRYFRQDEPNLPKARNRILAETTCDIVIYIDDDVKLSTGFVKAHSVNFKDNMLHAVCGRITERDILISPQVQRTWPKFLDYKYFDPGWTQSIENFGSIKGCNHSVRRASLLNLGGYDERYIGVALREETDLAFRIQKAGGVIRFDPAAYLHHLRAPAGGCRVSLWGDWSAGCAVLRFAIKHRKILGRYFWLELLHAYRLGVLNKNNLRHPLRMIDKSIIFAHMGLKLLMNPN